MYTLSDRNMFELTLQYTEYDWYGHKHLELSSDLFDTSIVIPKDKIWMFLRFLTLTSIDTNKLADNKKITVLMCQLAV